MMQLVEVVFVVIQRTGGVRGWLAGVVFAADSVSILGDFASSSVPICDSMGDGSPSISVSRAFGLDFV